MKRRVAVGILWGRRAGKRRAALEMRSAIVTDFLALEIGRMLDPAAALVEDELEAAVVREHVRRRVFEQR